MKIAEALQERADLSAHIEQLHERLNRNAVMQEGVPPVEDPAQLQKELETDFARLEVLITKINLSNAAHTVSGESLTALLARRDVMKMRLSVLRDVLGQASNLSFSVSRAEIRRLSAVDVNALRKELDELSREYRKLDNVIQGANWQLELME